MPPHLAKTDRLLDMLFKHTLDCVAVLDANYDFVRVNQSYARAADRPTSDYPGRNHFELYPSDAKHMFDTVVATKQPVQTFARPFVYPDQPERGTTYWDWTLVPLLDEAGEVELLMLTLRDVTRQKCAELELGRHRDELLHNLEDRTKEIELLHVELLARERLAALGRLLATVGHELRNPLGAIQASLDLIALRLRASELDLSKPMTRAEANIQRCHVIIEDLLDYTRSPKLDRQRTRFDAWVEATMSAMVLPPDVRCSLALGVGPEVEVDFDRDRLRRCLVNLVGNGLDAMRDSQGPRELSLETRRRDDRVELRLTDTGAGIEPARLESVFEPLTSTKTYGVGLGLPIVRQILRRHGGDVELDSMPGEGTTVTLWWPHP